jgi:hypothetical protein
MRYDNFFNPLFLIVLSFLVLFSCSGELISESDLIRIDDTIPPAINLDSPDNNGYYSSFVLVQGMIEDDADTRNTPGRVDSLSFQVLGTGTGGAVSFNEEGSFSFTFNSGDFEGEKTLVIIGTDWNGNSTEERITLNKGSFQGLSCTPGNKKIILDWKLPPGESPLIESYTLYYTSNGADPDTSNSIVVEDILPPYPLENLTNGLLYSCVIRGNITAGVDDLSEIVRAIPLSSFTLAPHVKGEYNEINLDWKGVPGADGYRILRSTMKNGLFTELPFILTTTSWTDTSVLPGQPYYYKIKPALEGSLPSEALYGESFAFPPFASVAGSCDTEDFSYNVAVAGSYAYVADRDSGLCVIDISDPTAPVLAGECELSGYAYDVAVCGTYAYVAADAAGLCVVNIADPSHPGPAVAFPVGGDAAAVTAAGVYVYVTVKNFGLQIVDVTDPLSPVPGGSYTFPGTAPGITLEGDCAYIAAGEEGLIVLNVSDPDNPVPAGDYDTPYCAYDVAVAGSYAYVADDVSGLQILDLSVLSAIDDVGSYDAPGPGGARGVDVRGIYAYVANDVGGVVVVNVSDPGEPVCVASCDSIACAKGIVVDKEYAYVAAYDKGISVLNCAEPSGASLAYTISTGGDVLGVALDGTHAYLAASGDGVLVYDVSPGSSPVIMDSYATIGTAGDVKVWGNFAFITGLYMGVEIISIADPTALAYVGICDITDSTFDAQLWGDLLYISYRDESGETGVMIYDVSDPWGPEFVSSGETDDYARGLALAGGYVYVADRNDGIFIMEMNGDEAAPAYNTSREATGITLYHNLLYISDGGGGIEIVDITQPLSPSFTGSYNTPGFTYGSALCGRYLFTADGLNGLVILDCYDPGTPFFAGNYPGQGAETTDVAVSGAFACIPAGNSMHIIDLWPYDDF